MGGDRGGGVIGYLMGGGQGALGTLSLTAQLLQGAVVVADVHLVFALDEFDEVVHHTMIKVLSSQMRVSASGDHLSRTRPLRFPSSDCGIQVSVAAL